MPTPRKTVLIVDDEPDILDMLDLLLRGDGYEVLKAAGGSATLALLQTRVPDLALLDIMMPDIDGHALCAQVRAMPAFRQMPVYMLTAKNQVAHIGRALDSGADGFIVKPFDTEELLRVVATRLGGAPTPFYRAASGETTPGSAARTTDTRIVCLSVSEPPAEFSVIVEACANQHHNLLSIWQRETPARTVTTAILNVTASAHFGDLLNRILGEAGVQVLHCSIYSRVEDVPMQKLEAP